MIIELDKLIEILQEYSEPSTDTTAREALGIDVCSSPSMVVDTITYHTIGDGTLAGDVNHEGKVVSIEIL